MAGKKKIVDIDEIGAEPLAEVATSRGTVFLYSPTDIAAGRWVELWKLPEDERRKQLLAELTSLVRRERISVGIQPLRPEDFVALTEEDVESLAEALRKALADRKIAPLKVEDQRPGESARAFFARIAEAEAQAESARLKATWDKAASSLGGSVAAMLRELEASRNRLGGTVHSLDVLNQRATEYRSADNSMLEYQARLAQERREERERVFLASQATAESARFLQQLAETAQAVMIRIAAQDVKLDRQTRIQLRVAVCSAVLGLIVSVVATVYAVRSYNHDIKKDAGDDAAIKAAAARDDRAAEALEVNAVLLQQNAQLLAEIKALRSPAKPASSPAFTSAKPDRRL